MTGIIDFFTCDCKQRLTIGTYASQETSPFFDADTAARLEVIPNFINDNFLELLYEIIKMRWGKYNIREGIESQYEADNRFIAKQSTIFFAVNAYEFNTMWRTTQFDYDPITNYDKKADITETHSGDDTDTFNKGVQTDITNTGSHTDNISLGSREDSTNYGTNKNTNTHNVSPNESTTFIAESQDISQNDTHTDTYSTGTQTNNNTYGAREDSATYGEREDKNVRQHGHIIHTVDETKGNIGVTTTQQMIREEREISNLSIVDYVASRLCYYLCEGVY